METNTPRFHVLTNRIPSRIVTVYGIEWVLVRRLGSSSDIVYYLAAKADDVFPADVKLIEVDANLVEE